ncbi:hypothetical protein RQP46_005591 [Phenoliferia psychrophenolica]
MLSSTLPSLVLGLAALAQVSAGLREGPLRLSNAGLASRAARGAAVVDAVHGAIEPSKREVDLLIANLEKREEVNLFVTKFNITGDLLTGNGLLKIKDPLGKDDPLQKEQPTGSDSSSMGGLGGLLQPLLDALPPPLALAKREEINLILVKFNITGDLLTGMGLLKVKDPLGKDNPLQQPQGSSTPVGGLGEALQPVIDSLALPFAKRQEIDLLVAKFNVTGDLAEGNGLLKVKDPLGSSDPLQKPQTSDSSASTPGGLLAPILNLLPLPPSLGLRKREEVNLIVTKFNITGDLLTGNGLLKVKDPLGSSDPLQKPQTSDSSASTPGGLLAPILDLLPLPPSLGLRKREEVNLIVTKFNITGDLLTGNGLLKVKDPLGSSDPLQQSHSTGSMPDGSSGGLLAPLLKPLGLRV